MKLIVIAGPPSAGKTALIKQLVRNLSSEMRIAFLKIDVVKAYEDEELKEEFGIETQKIYSGDLCPDHAGVMVLGDAIEWAESKNTDLFIVIKPMGLIIYQSDVIAKGIKSDNL